MLINVLLEILMLKNQIEIKMKRKKEDEKGLDHFFVVMMHQKNNLIHKLAILKVNE
jgi:hypothetical protein